MEPPLSELHPPGFSSEQWGTLQGFGLKAFCHDQDKAMASTLLLNDDQCRAVLKKIMPELGAANLKITASLVIKRIAFLTLAPTLFAMSRYHLDLNMSIENCVFEYPLKNKIWQSQMPLMSFELSLYKPEQDRNAWREEILKNAFANHLSLLVEQFHRVTRVSKRILWENVAIRVFSIYERRILNAIPDNLLPQAQQDFLWLIDAKNHALFATDHNPIAEFYSAKIPSPTATENIRVRSTCCFYFKATEPSEHCSICPRLHQRALQASK